MAKSEKPSKIAQMQALGPPGIFRQVVRNSAPARAQESKPQSQSSGANEYIEHLEAEVRRLKRELASRPEVLPDPVTNPVTRTVTQVVAAGNAVTRLSPAEKQRRYRERQKQKEQE